MVVGHQVLSCPMSPANPAQFLRAGMDQGSEACPNSRGQIQSCLALSPSHLFRGVCSRLFDQNASNANTRRGVHTMKRNVWFICRICTVYTNISSLPEQVFSTITLFLLCLGYSCILCLFWCKQQIWEI